MFSYILVLNFLILFTFSDAQKEPFELGECNKTPNGRSIYDFEVKKLDGTRVSLKEFRGRVLLISNVATFCGYTGHYLGFNHLLGRYVNDGLSILAFPCNQFGKQEPNENKDILDGLKNVNPGNGFTPLKDLHVFGKIDVNGRDEHPLFEFLKQTCPSEVIRRDNGLVDEVNAPEVQWNFEKILIDRLGRPRYRFHPSQWQGGEAVKPYLEKLLKESQWEEGKEL